MTWPDTSQGILGTDQDNNGAERCIVDALEILANNGSPDLTWLANTGRSRSALKDEFVTHFGLFKGLWSPVEGYIIRISNLYNVIKSSCFSSISADTMYTLP